MSALPPIQPPPNPWQGAVAAVAAPPPLPQVPLPDTTPSAVPAASVPATPPPNRLPVRWLAWEKADSLEGRAISRPDPRQLEVAYWLASLLPFATAFSAAPALPHMHFAGTPIWAQLMLFAAVVQIGYAAWLALLPDVSTIRVGLYLFAASAVAGLAAMLAILLLNNSQLSALNLSGMRGAAVAWCGLVFVVASLTSAACGWIATHWQDMG